MEFFKRYYTKLNQKGIINRNNKKFIDYVIALVIVILFVIIGRTIANPQRTVSAFEDAVNKNDTEALSKIMYSYDKEFNITSDNVKPLLDDFKAAPSQFREEINDLHNQALNIKNGEQESKKSQLYITRSGKIMVFFPRYKISFKPAFLTVTSSVEGAEILVNGNTVGKVDSKKFSRQLGPYIPGIYNVRGKANGDFGNMESNINVDFIKNKKQKETVNALKPLYLKVNSNYANNAIYINGKYTGKSVNSGDKIGPIASQSNIYAMTSYNGKMFKSSNLKLSDTCNTINLKYPYIDGSDQLIYVDIHGNKAIFPVLPKHSQKYYTIYAEGFRNNRVELALYDVDGEFHLDWKGGLYLSDRKKCINYIHYYLTNDDTWTRDYYDGSEYISDLANDVYLANANVYKQN